MTNPMKLAKDSKELDRLTSELTSLASHSIRKETLDEVIDSWVDLFNSYRGACNEQCKFLLEQVFNDVVLCKCLGPAHQLRHIKGAPPEGLLHVLKIAKARLKSNL